MKHKLYLFLLLTTQTTMILPMKQQTSTKKSRSSERTQEKRKNFSLQLTSDQYDSDEFDDVDDPTKYTDGGGVWYPCYK